MFDCDNLTGSLLGYMWRTRGAQVGLAVAHAGVLNLHAHIVAGLVPAGMEGAEPLALTASSVDTDQAERAPTAHSHKQGA